VTQIVPASTEHEGGGRESPTYHGREARRSTRGEAWQGREGAKEARRGGALPFSPPGSSSTRPRTAATISTTTPAPT
jgi:hypothetical protein